MFLPPGCSTLDPPAASRSFPTSPPHTPDTMAMTSEAELSAFLVPVGEIDGALDWDRIFDRRGPVEVEIGCGKGRFLMERALAEPSRNLLGVDWGLPWLRRTARRLERSGVENVRLLRTNAKHLIRFLIPAKSLEILHVYFPDPWPKKRHHKRRLFDPPTTKAMEKILKPGGRLHVATDFGDYFDVIRERISEDTRLEHLPEMEAMGATASNFGIKYTAQGRTIHQGVWERKP